MKFAVVLPLLAGCASHPRALPIYGQVPAFNLTSQSGQPFDRKSLEGRIWVADFIFTNCEGPCPRMSAQMQKLQQAAPDLELVSFTVDPARDTPVVLADYARRFHASSSWHMLTGDPATLQLLDREAFKLGNLGAAMDHSTRFVLIDRKSRVRGYYGLSQGNPIERIIADAHQLAAGS